MGCTPSVSSLAFVLAKVVAYCSTSCILSLARISSGPPRVIYVTAPTTEKNFLEVPWLVGGINTHLALASVASGPPLEEDKRIVEEDAVGNVFVPPLEISALVLANDAVIL